MTDETSKIIKDDRVSIKMQSEWDQLQSQADEWKKVATHLLTKCNRYIEILYGKHANEHKHKLSEESGYFKTLLSGVKNEKSN